MKEMVGGCCVCSDERGWPENPLVYCDGQHCTVAVHQACYGIVTVPIGPWFCRKCESQERPTRVRCELCPSKDGALKRTDTQSWAHVVCALYIPEVRFGNVTTMEPIILQLIPQERYSKVCYICQDVGKGSKAQVGACMPCNKSGCKQQFHVTCAQTLGLLCEEAGNYLDNVKYCGYCQHHYSKLKKGGNVKTIPPYKPVNVSSSDPSSSPEKETDTVPSSSSLTNVASSTVSSVTNLSTSLPKIILQTLTVPTNLSNQISAAQSSSSNSKQRKTGSSSSSQSSQSSSSKQQSSNQSSSTSSSSSSAAAAAAAINPSNNSNANTSANNNNTSSNNSSSSINENSSKEKDKSNRSVNKVVSSSSKSSSKDSRDKYQSSKSQKSHSGKDSTSTDHDSGNHTQMDTNATSSIIKNVNTLPIKEGLGQKFTTSNFTETVVVNSEPVFGSEIKSTNHSSSGSNATPLVKKRKLDAGKSSNSSVDEINRDMIKDVSVTLVPLPLDKVDSTDAKKVKQKIIDSSPKPVLHTSSSTPNIIVHPTEALKTTSYTNVLAPTTTTTGVSLVVSVPLSTAGVTLPLSTSSILNSSNHQVQSTKLFAPPLADSMPSTIINRSNIVVSTITGQPVGPSHFEKDPLGGLNEKPVVVVKNPILAPATIQLNKLSNVLDSNKINHSGTQSPITTAQQMVQQCLEPPLGGNAGLNVSVNVINSTPTITTMESGGIKVTYDKQLSMKTSQSHDDNGMGRITSTPDDNSSGPKFCFEPQSTLYPPATLTPMPDIKDSPPSSPGSEAGSKKRLSIANANDLKDYKLFPKGVTATHMLGNQLNPASSVAQKMTDQLYMEIEEHSAYTSSSLDSAAPLIGPMFPGKYLNNARNSAPSQPQGPSLSSMLGGTGTPSATGNTPQSLEQLLERQWEQGSQFLMEQAQHFDIASLLSCLHQLKTENIRLEEHVSNLVARRDHLLAVNARLAIPLNPIPAPNINPTQATFNNMHTNGSSEPPAIRRAVENQNGLDFRHSIQPPQMNARFDVINKRSKNENR